MPIEQAPKVFKAVVIGTGFAGAVTACRLVEAGFEICVLERGRRYGPADFPSSFTTELFAAAKGNEHGGNDSGGDFSRWLWGSDHGLYDVRHLDEVVAVQSAAYGGGSLIYANVHLRPPKKVFDSWPPEYRKPEFDHYFDLAAYMLDVVPIPNQLAKTKQLQRAAAASGSDPHYWFRTPLAVTFDRPKGQEDSFDRPVRNKFNRQQYQCDMRGRCFLGCDRQAKNTLDLNYLARAEDGTPSPDIRTLAEVKHITRANNIFTVTYLDHLFDGAKNVVYAENVFLCAGSIGTTELLLNNPELSRNRQAIGSHYYPNSDAFTAVFDCDEPQEADYGPTITSAILHQRPVDGRFRQSINFSDGRLTHRGVVCPTAGLVVTGRTSGAAGVLAFPPVLDWGSWTGGTAVGSLIITEIKTVLDEGAEGSIHGRRFVDGEELDIGGRARVQTRSAAIDHEHWFLVEDGGYPSNMAPLVGLFRSPLWLRRNRFNEPSPHRQRPPVRAPRAQSSDRAQVRAIAAALGNTTSRAASRDGILGRAFSTGRTPQNVRTPLADVLQRQISTFFPPWFVTALKAEHDGVLEQGAAAALPMLGRLLDDLSSSIVTQVNRGSFSFLPKDIEGSDDKQQVLVRGMLRQALQILAGSEATIARQAIELIFERVQGTPEGLLQMLSDALLWVLAYGAPEGHTALLLTMGRDPFRGRLLHDKQDTNSSEPRLIADVPSPRIDASGQEQERVIRHIASDAWGAELRTNPIWTPIQTRVTVHSQGGCPMGAGTEAPDASVPGSREEILGRRFSVTDPDGRVRGCERLYVMDAAAFPTSVGVNPSATIAAVAEFKVEQFIRRELNDPKWEARDKVSARTWCDQRRSALDPLNPPPDGASAPHPATTANAEPKLKLIGLEFAEEMHGSFAAANSPTRHTSRLSGFSRHKQVFLEAEDSGLRQGNDIETHFRVEAEDLAELVSNELVDEPARVKLTGNVKVTFPGEDPVKLSVAAGSFVQFFIKPPVHKGSPIRFFRYGINCDGKSPCRIDALKVLRNDPGSDVWADTSTLFFELIRPDHRMYRGVMRLSFEQFLQAQLPSMTVTNTKDETRMIWALVAFYKYFARGLADVYMERLDAFTQLAVNVLTGIHV